MQVLQSSQEQSSVKEVSSISASSDSDGNGLCHLHDGYYIMVTFSQLPQDLRVSFWLWRRCYQHTAAPSVPIQQKPDLSQALVGDLLPPASAVTLVPALLSLTLVRACCSSALLSYFEKCCDIFCVHFVAEHLGLNLFRKKKMGFVNSVHLQQFYSVALHIFI